MTDMMMTAKQFILSEENKPRIYHMKKKLHFLAGIIIIAILGGVIIDPITGLGFAIAAGIAKECYDDWKYNGYDIKDMIATWVATGIGGCVGFTVVSLINYWR